MILRFLRALRRHRRGERGSATIEFAILFPIFMSLFLAFVETGIFMVRSVMLDRGVNLAVRELRLGSLVNPTFIEFKQVICDQTLLFENCMNNVKVELQPINTTTWATLGVNAQCRDVEQPIDPTNGNNMTTGTKNELMMVRVCGLYRPWFPSTPLALRLRDMGGGSYALIVQTAFVNEPQVS